MIAILNKFRSEIFRAIKFLIVGGTGMLVSVMLLFLLTEIFGFYYMVSALIVGLINTTYNYFMNNYWSFSDRKNTEMKAGYGRFVVVMILYFVLYYSTLYVFTEWLLKDFSFYFIKGYMISAVFATVIATFPKYLLCWVWVWKK